MDPPSPSLDPESCVTASDLVRRFGIWQERALRQPVYVLRRGRPSLVLTSFDLMGRLCAPHQPPAPAEGDALLLDSMREIVVRIDIEGRLRTLNRAGRLAFSITDAGAHGQPLSRLLSESVAAFVVDLASRARRAAAIEQAEIAVGDRQYRLTVAPRDDGALLIAADTTEDCRAEVMRARHLAFLTAADATEAAATARINLRGYIHDASPALSRLSGIAPDALSSVRFVTLFDIASRVRVGDAIEAAIADGGARTIDGALNTRHGRLVETRIGLAGERVRGGITGVAATILAVEAASEN